MTDAAPALERRLAAELLRIGAVALSPAEPFTWASGLHAPIYCDSRLTMAYPEVRRLVAEGFAETIRRQAWRPEVVAGTATAGIPHAAWLAERLDLPMAYVRAQPKGHGRGNQIEGRVRPGQRVVLIEDLISTGGSSRAAAEALRAAGADVQALLAIFSYGFAEATALFEQAALPMHTLTTFDVLLGVAEQEQRLGTDALATLHAWQRDPHAWSETSQKPNAEAP